MKDKANRITEKNILVSINGKQTNKIPLENIRQNVIDLVITESIKYPETRTAKGLAVSINGKNVIPKDVRNMNIEDIQTIEIFGNVINNVM